jgi:hypothetical protein
VNGVYSRSESEVYGPAATAIVQDCLGGLLFRLGRRGNCQSHTSGRFQTRMAVKVHSLIRPPTLGTNRPLHFGLSMPRSRLEISRQSSSPAGPLVF